MNENSRLSVPISIALKSTILLFVLLFFTTAVFGEKVELKRNSQNWLILSNDKNGWNVKSLHNNIKVRKSRDTYVVKTKNQTYQIRYKNDKYTVYGPDALFLYRVKFSKDKIKISEQKNGPYTWVLKRKSDKYKIKLRNDENGKISYSRNSNKVKLKSHDNTEICSMNYPNISPAPVVCYLDYPDEHLLILFFILLR